MSAVDEIREAAALMQQRAEGATSDAEWSNGNYWVTDYDPSDPTGQTPMQRLLGGMDGPDADHFEAWTQEVALAVADWLNLVADRYAEYAPDSAPSSPMHSNWHAAFAVARAYLGRSA